MNKHAGRAASLAGALILSLAVVLFSPLAAADGAVAETVNYGDVSLSGGFMASHFSDVWDLTASDITISFTYDANGLVDSSGSHAWTELGVHDLSTSVDFNPGTWITGGAGVWLATDYDWTAGTFAPDPDGSPRLDLDDKLILQRGGGADERYYDLPSAPPAGGNNHRVWFDRDGVDQWQAQSPLAVDGGTYNTGGNYHIVIILHATSATTGTAYMTINGLSQGFETDGNWNTMELSPAGMTFGGDMARLQVFYGIYGYGETHSMAFKGITVTGVRDTAPPSITIASPEAKAYAQPGGLMLDFSAEDPFSGLASLTADLDGAPATSGQAVDLGALAAGTHTLTVTALDRAGNSATKSVTFTVTNPMYTKQATVAELQAAMVYSSKINKKIDQIIDDIERSLDPNLWVDGSHLKPIFFHKVFDAERRAVDKIKELSHQKGLPAELGAILNDVALKLLAADMTLAQTELAAAQAIANPSGWTQREIEKSQKELDRAGSAEAKGDYDKAIDHYELAYLHALLALKIDQ